MRKIEHSGIYKITNIVSGKFYIGSAINFETRKRNHWSSLRRNKHINKHLQNAWNLVGEENFKIDIIEEVPIFENETREEFKIRLVNDREQFYLDTFLFANQNDRRFYELGYNKNRIASSSLGSKRSDEIKLKLSIAHMGIRPSEDTRKKMCIIKSGINNPFYGKRHTIETCKKISKANLGKKLSTETKKKISKAFYVPIVQYELRKKFIKKWNTFSEVKKCLNISHIKKSNFYWEYDVDKNILQFEFEKIIIKKWNSMNEASQALNIDYQRISYFCRNNRQLRKMINKIYWEYAK